MRDAIAHLHTPHFYRLRIGIGHPGGRHQVLDYVLSSPSKTERQQMNDRLEDAIEVLPYLFEGANEKAIQILHTSQS